MMGLQEVVGRINAAVANKKEILTCTHFLDAVSKNCILVKDQTHLLVSLNQDYPCDVIKDVFEAFKVP